MHISIIYGSKSQIAQLNLNSIVQALHSDIMFMSDDVTATFIEKIIAINQRFDLAPRALIITSDPSITFRFLQELRATFPQIQESIDAQQLIPVPMTAPFWRARMEAQSRHAEWERNLLASDIINSENRTFGIFPDAEFWRNASARTLVPAHLLEGVARGNTKMEQHETRSLIEEWTTISTAFKAQGKKFDDFIGGREFADKQFPVSPRVTSLLERLSIAHPETAGSQYALRPLPYDVETIGRALRSEYEGHGVDSAPKHYTASDVSIEIKNSDGTFTKLQGFDESTRFDNDAPMPKLSSSFKYEWDPAAEPQKNNDTDSQN